MSLENEQSIYYKRMVVMSRNSRDSSNRVNVMEAYNCFDLGMMLMNAMQVQVPYGSKNGVECYLDKQIPRRYHHDHR